MNPNNKAIVYAASTLLAMLVAFGFLNGDVAEKALSIIGKNEQAEIIVPPQGGESREIDRRAIEVVKVIDGETVEVAVNGQKEVVKLIGINAPDPGDARATLACQAELSKNYLGSRLEEKSVFIANDPQLQKYDGERYQLVFMYTGKVSPDNLVNLGMITEGYANAREYDVKHSYEFLFRQKWSIARDAKLGLWADGACE